MPGVTGQFGVEEVSRKYKKLLCFHDVKRLCVEGALFMFRSRKLTE